MFVIGTQSVWNPDKFGFTRVSTLRKELRPCRADLGSPNMLRTMRMRIRVQFSILTQLHLADFPYGFHEADLD